MGCGRARESGRGDRSPDSIRHSAAVVTGRRASAVVAGSARYLRHVPEALPTVVYRIVASATPARVDFLSDAASGRPARPLSPEKVRLREGFSVLRTEAQARRLIRGSRSQHGRHIAIVRVPPTAVIERSLHRPGHFTAYGDPDEFLRHVVRVEPGD